MSQNPARSPPPARRQKWRPAAMFRPARRARSPRSTRYRPPRGESLYPPQAVARRRQEGPEGRQGSVEAQVHRAAIVLKDLMAAEKGCDGRACARPRKAEGRTIAFAAAGFAPVARGAEAGHGDTATRAGPSAAIPFAGDLHGGFGRGRRGLCRRGGIRRGGRLCCGGGGRGPLGRPCLRGGLRRGGGCCGWRNGLRGGLRGGPLPLRGGGVKAGHADRSGGQGACRARRGIVPPAKGQAGRQQGQKGKGDQRAHRRGPVVPAPDGPKRAGISTPSLRRPQ